MSQISILAGHDDPLMGPFPKPLLETTTFLALVDELVSRASALAAGHYKGSRGSHCAILVGQEPDIGMSTFLRAFAYTCNAAFPTVIPVYVNANLLGEWSSFRRFSLRGVMTAAARAHGLSVENGGDGLERALEASGRKMLVLVDEIDGSFRVGPRYPVGDTYNNLFETFRELSAFGYHTRGHFSIVLCGHSQRTPLLLSGMRGEAMGECPQLYHLINAGVPHLTNYAQVRIPVALCNDSSQVLRLADQLGLWPDVTDETERLKRARVVTFLVGTHPGALTRALPRMGKGSMDPFTIGDFLDAQHRRRWDLNGLLRAANKPLVERLTSTTRPGKRTRLLHELVSDTEPWEELVRPVPCSAIELAWREGRENAKLGTDSRMFESWLADQIDDGRRLMSVTRGNVDARTGAMEERLVWPPCAAQMGCEHWGIVSVTKELVDYVATGTMPTCKRFFLRLSAEGAPVELTVNSEAHLMELVKYLKRGHLVKHGNDGEGVHRLADIEEGATYRPARYR